MTDTMTLEEYHAKLGPKKKRSKYNAQTVWKYGIKFDSLAEARRYDELLILVEQGLIYNLSLQPIYELQPSFKTKDGQHIKRIVYKADFSYVEPDTVDGITFYNRVIVEDVKGFQTAVFRLKHKWFLRVYPDLDLRLIPAK